jgi:hypothetical protein
MSTIILAHFDGEHFVPDAPVTGIAVGDRVHVLAEVKSTKHAAESAGPDLHEDPLMQMVGFAVDTGIPDLAENADYYLYGHPKQSDQGNVE